MDLRYYLEFGLQKTADLVLMIVPQRRPSQQALQDCKIVSHRGEHDNKQVMENTLAAFTRVQQAGVWGIEFDLRWTLDLHPVVLHDSNTLRVFNIDLAVAETSLQDLQQHIPEIPTLVEVVARFGGNIHMMVEIKPDEVVTGEIKRARLREIFSGLSAGVDYHFLALQPDLFDIVDFAGGGACIPVAEFNIGACSQQALARELGGFCGQYLLMSNRLIRRHRQLEQKIGTGFAASRFCFYRELNRGVDWIFTNHALRLRAIQQELLRNC